MLIRRLKARTPSATAQRAAFVDGHRLTFDKKSTDGSGKCDIEVTGDSADRVYGVLFQFLPPKLMPSTKPKAFAVAIGKATCRL